MTDPSIQDTDSQVQQLIDTGTTELRKDVIGAQKECTYNPQSRLYNSHSQQFSNMEDTVALHRDNMVLVKPEDEQEQGIALLNDSRGKKSKFRDERENQLWEGSEKGQQLNECNEEDATDRFIPEGGLQHQASIVHWERFLPKQQLRVLLVEDDDSTRHVLCTLLRNCSYEVTCAVNGMEAWGLLENRNYHFDLVLTEVAMPYLSGIALLANIMGDEDCKRIPVIMMSSHDSMGVVFKCLSKGAVDFLVKPVRKNELKTLWQHVWRRCHSQSGGNGSGGSGSQAQKALGIDCRADSPSNDDTKNGSDNDSRDLNNQDGTDNASGMQGSWTKKARQEGILQVECQATYIQRQYSKMPGSEEIQREGIQDHTVAEMTGIETSLKEEHVLSDFGRKGILLSTSSGGKENKAGADAGKGGPVEDSTIAIDLNGQIAYEMVIKRDKKDIGMEDISLQRSTHESTESKKNIVSDLRLTPVLKLTLKRCCQGEEEQGETNKRQSLRHSYPSAFSRYNNSPKSTTLSSSGFSSINAYSIPSVSTGHSFMQGTGINTTNLSASQPAMHAERNCFTKGACEILLSPPKVEVKSDKLGQLPEHSPTNTVGKDEAVPFLSIPQQLSVPPLPPGIWTYNGLPTPYSPVFFSNPTVQYWSSSPEVVSRLNSSDQCVQQNPPALHPQVYYNHGNQHHHVHHHNQQHSSQLSLGSQQKKDQTLSNLGRRASLGSLSMELLEDESSQTWDGDGQGRNANLHGNTINGNGSVNRSATGSNNPDYGIYGQSNNQSGIQTVDGENGDSTAQNGADVAELGNEITANTASNEGVLGTQQNSSTRREAALTKFRQKRKERCFEKKVRYQSRKRLAEQRPRVRGQFVRQSVYRFTEGEAL